MSTRKQELLGDSPAFKKALEQAFTAAPRPEPVLIYGETGTGKGLLAEIIHARSGRSGPFVSINSSTFNPNLFESHLFGYVKGAFTGADRNTPGLFETAQGGTLFLDEIADTPLEVQPRLLRALEERLIRRVGGRDEVPIDVRLVCATNKDLRAAIAQGRFREDLFYRINAFIVTLPPLREREGDIAELAQHFLASMCEERELPLRKFTPEALEALNRYAWPGNVRELRSAVAYALAARPDATDIALSDLPAAVLALPKAPDTAQAAESEDVRLFRELYSSAPEDALAWARFLVAFQARIKNVRFARHDMVELLRAARGQTPTDNALVNEWQRRIKPIAVSLGLITEVQKKLQINLERCHDVLAQGGEGADALGARRTAVISPSRPTPSNRLKRTNLPPPRTSFVGRQSEIVELENLLKQAPALVTLTGPGGTGKTRLALETGWHMLDHLPGGVWFADLTEARNVEGVAYAVAQALRVPLTTHEAPESAVASILESRGNALLILDNFEQVVQAAEKTAGLWAKRAPALRILITSRALLSLEGERSIELKPLSVPPRNSTLKPEELAKFDAVQLFTERANLAHYSFTLDEKSAPAVAEICNVVEGMPLALELAAARVSIMKPEQMVARLVHKFDFLRSTRRDLNERQRSLLATIEWSYNLLSEAEQRAFALLGAFKGGWFLEAAERVLGPGLPKGTAVLDVIQSLRDKSLIRSWDTTTETRFGMYDAIADFAQRKLVDTIGADERYALMRRHAEYFTLYAEYWDKQIFTGNELEGCDRLEIELENLFEAQEWLSACLAGEKSTCEEQERNELREWLARSVLAAAHIMRVRGPLQERVPRQSAAAQALGPGDSESRARLLAVLASAHADNGDWQKGDEVAQAALEMARRVGSVRVEALALIQQGWLLSARGEMAKARERYELVIPMFAAIGDLRNKARAIGRLGYLLARDGQLERGSELLREAESLLESEGDRFGLGFQLITRSTIELRRGDCPEALKTLERAERHFRELGDKRQIATCLGNRALILKLVRDYDGALRCTNDCHSLALEVGDLSIAATNLTNRGHLLVDLDRLDEAQAAFTDAEKRHRQLNNLPHVAVSLEVRGWIAARKGNLDAAMQLYAQAEELAIGRDQDVLAGIWTSKAESLLEAGKAAQAVELAEKARGVFESRNVRGRDLFKAMSVQARSLSALKKKEDAKKRAQEARELGSSLGYSENDPALRIKRDWAELARITGKSQKAESPPADSY
jgi:transcriptional regulator with AAA-type ATPase domain/predicted ATPase/Tfp pilus assembly protein PilF